MNLSFRNRIALHYMIATAIIIAFVFGVVYFIVEGTVYRNLDNELSYEAKKHTKEIGVNNDRIYFINKDEWEEIEHKEVQVNPVFIQMVDVNGKVMDKSPNLKKQELVFQSLNNEGKYLDSRLNNRSIRQVQIPIEKRGKIKGYVIAAMSLESTKMVINNLRKVLSVSYPIVLLGLFFISRYLAGSSIVPIKDIIETTNRITKNNLNERVVLPERKDELYKLSSSINELLLRIENAIQRERQFTSDASHELRTPLSSLRGTLEILVRKPRTQTEYEEKIQYSLSEIDKMSEIIEQLLQLARFEDNKNTNENSKVPLVELIDEILSRHKKDIADKQIKIHFDVEGGKDEHISLYYSNLILDNIISNALKYSKIDGNLFISVSKEDDKIICTIRDEGIGVKAEDLSNIFIPFFRSDALTHKQIPGNGLGLSIAKKAADAIHAEIVVESEYNVGTTFTIQF